MTLCYKQERPRDGFAHGSAVCLFPPRLARLPHVNGSFTVRDETQQSHGVDDNTRGVEL